MTGRYFPQKSSLKINSAFTLFEILLVVVVISIFAVLAIVAFNPVGQIEKSKTTKRLAAIDSIEKAIDRYDYEQSGYAYNEIPEYTGIDIGGECPQCEMCLNSSNCAGYTDLTFLAPKYLKSIPSNPNFSDSALSGYFAYKKPGTSKINILAEATNGYLDTTGTSYSVFRYLGTETNALASFPAESVVVDSSINVFSETRQNYTFFSSDFIPVDVNSRYQLKGEFKGTGAISSRINFGVALYDKDQVIITPRRVLRIGNDVTVSSFNSTQIVAGTALSGWYNTGALGHQRTIGFYYDGNINKLPDYVWFDSTNGVYSSYTGNTLTLVTSIPTGQQANIIPGTTKIMNHYSGATYQYVGGSSIDIPAVWTLRSGIIQSENTMGADSANKFRFGTVFAKIMLASNTNSASTNEYLLIKNVRFGQELP